MTTTAPLPTPDVTDMIAVHRVFRDTLRSAPALVGAVEADDRDRVALLANFYENLLDFLAVHHGGEDELLFPLLRERCVDDRELVDRVSGQHHDVDHLVAEATAALAAWQSGADGSARRCADALAALGAGLGEHLDDEEREVLPLCERHLSLPEWGALPAHAMAAYRGDKPWLILGLIRQRMSQAQREDMMAHMPPPAVQMWTGFGEQAFTDLMARIGPPLG
jgi:hemerythrin-like domain-containing protein